MIKNPAADDPRQHQYSLKAQDNIPVKAIPTEIFRTVKKDPNDTLNWHWKRGGIVNVNFSQGTLSNWAAGGDNFTLAINSYTNYFYSTRASITPGTTVWILILGSYKPPASARVK